MSRHRNLSARGTLLRAAIHIFVVLALGGGATLLTLRAFDRLGPAETAEAAVNGDGTSAHQQEALFDRNATLLVITDSMGGGIGDGTIKRWPDVLADNMHWNVVVDAMGARGFLPTDASNVGVPRPVPPFIDALKYDADTYRADYIIVDGGRNDLGKDPDLFAPAYDEYMTALRSYYPQAKIISLVPSYITPQRAELYEANSAAVRQSAEKVGAYVLDPFAEGWFENIDLAPLLWTDGVHLNGAGAEYYAQEIVDGMRRLGILSDSESVQGAR
jgi:lysophospholipase L1-like esterase